RPPRGRHVTRDGKAATNKETLTMKIMQILGSLAAAATTAGAGLSEARADDGFAALAGVDATPMVARDLDAVTGKALSDFRDIQRIATHLRPAAFPGDVADRARPRPGALVPNAIAQPVLAGGVRVAGPVRAAPWTYRPSTPLAARAPIAAPVRTAPARLSATGGLIAIVAR
ncbi:MAG: hypothetical protein AAGC56_15330, partial [Pseudomonadota bacterium]